MMLQVAANPDMPNVLPSGYKWAPVNWTIAPFPGNASSSFNFTGSMQDALARALSVNPDYLNATDFRGFSEHGLDGPAHDRIIDMGCFPADWKDADIREISFGIKYLNKLEGRPVNDPQTCSHIACYGDSAIWWCNDMSKVSANCSAFRHSEEFLTRDKLGFRTDDAQFVG